MSKDRLVWLDTAQRRLKDANLPAPDASVIKFIERAADYSTIAVELIGEEDQILRLKGLLKGENAPNFVVQVSARTSLDIFWEVPARRGNFSIKDAGSPHLRITIGEGKPVFVGNFDPARGDKDKFIASISKALGGPLASSANPEAGS